MPTTVKQPETAAQLEPLVRLFEQDVYAELFDFLRSREARRDSLESQATDLTRRIMAHGKLMQETLVGMRQPDGCCGCGGPLNSSGGCDVCMAAE